MAYREITMIEIKEVLRRWVSGIPKKRLAAQLGLDPKTVRRYVQVAEQCGVRLEDGLAGLTDDRVGAVIIALKQPAAHPHGDPWWACEAGHRVGHTAQHLHGGIGADVDYPIHRYYLWAKQIELMLGGGNRILARFGSSLSQQTIEIGL